MTIRRIGKTANRGGMAFKPSLQDMRRASLAAQQAMAGPNTSEAGRKHLAEFAATVKPKVSRGPRTASVTASESEVQRSIIAFLCGHQKVALVIRFNSGAVSDGKSYIEFAHIYSRGFHGENLRLPDVYALLRDGRTMWIECKRADWTRTHGGSTLAIREKEQCNFLEHVEACGGIGIFATSIDDVERAL